MSPLGFTITATRFAATHFRLPRHRELGILASRFHLQEVNREWQPDLIVPLDDNAAWLLRGLATDISASVELRHLLEVSLGSPSGYEADLLCRCQGSRENGSDLWPQGSPFPGRERKRIDESKKVNRANRFR